MIRVGDIRKLSRICIQDLTNTLITERKNRIISKFSLDDSQQRVVDSQAKFIRVVAPAGSGKTQTLIAKALNLLDASPMTGILCLTFTNAAATEIQNRAVKELEPSLFNRLQVSTLNAFGYELLKSINPSLQIVSSNGRSIGGAYKIIKKLMEESSIWGNQAKSKLYAPIFELTNMMKSLGFDHKSSRDEAKERYALVKALGMSSLLENLVEDIELNGNFEELLIDVWIPFWTKLSDEIWKSNLISLEDQKYWAMNQLVSNHQAQSKLLNKKFSHLLIDEFQDINILDLFLIAEIAYVLDSSLIIVGDDDQCIYEWRGCTSVFIQKPEMSFGQILNGKFFETILLDQNYRCPRNIVVHSENLINHNSNRIHKKMIPVRKDDANIRIVSLPAAFMTMNVVVELIEAISKIDPNHTVAIVGRKKCQLIPIQILLTKKEIKFLIDTDLNVFGGNAFKDFRHFLELPRIYESIRPDTENVADMMSLLNRVQKNPVGKQEREEIQQWLIQHKPQTLKDSVELFSDYLGQFKRGSVRPSDVSARLKSFLEKSSVVACVKVASDVFKGFQKDFVKSKEDIFYSDPPFSHLADLAVNYDKDFQSFLLDVDRAIERAISNDPREAKIELMTALRTKGREFDGSMSLFWDSLESQ